MLFTTTEFGLQDAKGVKASNATARFIIIWSILSTAIACLFSLLRGENKLRLHFLFIGGVMLAFAGLSAETHTVPQNGTVQEMKYCQAPTTDNPMANPLPNDYGNGVKMPACPSDAVSARVDATIDALPITSVVAAEAGDDAVEYAGRRSFYSLPATTVPQNVENFRNALYGENISRRVDHGFDVNMFNTL